MAGVRRTAKPKYDGRMNPPEAWTRNDELLNLERQRSKLADDVKRLTQVRDKKRDDWTRAIERKWAAEPRQFGRKTKRFLEAKARELAAERAYIVAAQMCADAMVQLDRYKAAIKKITAHVA
jgi:hypothetical protein